MLEGKPDSVTWLQPKPDIMSNDQSKPPGPLPPVAPTNCCSDPLNVTMLYEGHTTPPPALALPLAQVGLVPPTPPAALNAAVQLPLPTKRESTPPAPLRVVELWRPKPCWPVRPRPPSPPRPPKMSLVDSTTFG